MIPENLEFESGNSEIRQFNWLLHLTALYMLVFMAVVIAVAKLTSFYVAIYFVPILGIGWAWAMARYDFLMHRRGAFLTREFKSPWENSPERSAHPWMMVITDAFSIVPYASLFGYAEWVIWTEYGSREYVVITTVLFLVGIGMIAVAGTMFRKAKSKGE